MHLHGVDPGRVNPPPRITHSHACVTSLTGKRSVVSAHTVGAAVVGETVGDADGVGEGSTHLTPLPLPLPLLRLGQVGPGVGEPEGLTDGLTDGVLVGLEVGAGVGALVGLEVGVALGLAVGDEVGLALGDADGDEVGLTLGDAVGLALGDAVGDEVGVTDGAKDGLSVHNPQLRRQFAAASGYASHLHGHLVEPGLRFTQSQRRISLPPVPGTRNLPGLS